MRCPWMKVWLAFWMAAGSNERLEWTEILTMVVYGTATCKICQATKNGDALE